MTINYLTHHIEDRGAALVRRPVQSIVLPGQIGYKFEEQGGHEVRSIPSARYDGFVSEWH